MKLLGNWSYPTNIRFGAGRISEIVDACKTSGISNPLLVTDRVLADLPITAQTLDLLETGGLGHAIFSDVDPNSSGDNVEVGLSAYREGAPIPAQRSLANGFHGRSASGRPIFPGIEHSG